MKLRLRLVWNKASVRDPRVRALHGLACVVDDETAAGHFKTLWLDARSALKICAVTAVVLWLGAAGGLSWRLRQIPHNRIGFADLALPWHWRRISDLRGQTFIASGLEKLSAGRVNEGIREIRQGLVRHPDAPEARLTVARAFARSGYYRGVREIMLPQLEQRGRPSRDFVRFLLEVAAANEDQSTMLSTCERALAASGGSADERAWLNEQKAAALLALERHTEALTALDAAGEGHSLEWRRLRVVTLCAAGRATEAIDEIRRWSDELPEDFRIRTLAATLARAGRRVEARASFRALQASHPTEPQPWVEAIAEYVRAGWHDVAAGELQEYLWRFGADPVAMGNMERVCAVAGSVDLLMLCLKHAEELGRPTGSILIDLVVVSLKARDTQRAERWFRQMLVADARARERPAGFPATTMPESNEKDVVPLFLRDWTRTLIETMTLPAGDSAEVLCTVLEKNRMPSRLFAITAEVLAENERWPAVAATMRVGLAKFPSSGTLEQWHRKAVDKIAAMPRAQPDAVAQKAEPLRATPESPRGLSDAQRNVLLTQTEFLAKLDETAGRRAWSEAESMIRALRGRPPEWLPAVQGELSWREVRYALEQAETLRAESLMAMRLRVRPTEGPIALALARDWLGRGDKETALRIAERIVGGVPGFEPGRAFRDELAPPTGPVQL